MSNTTPLITLIDGLLRDPAARLAYAADAEGFLAARGWRGLEAEDLTEALSVARHVLPADVAADVPDPDFSADPYAVLDHVAGVEPLSELVEDPLAGVDGGAGAAEIPRFGSGTDSADGPEPAGAEAEAEAEREDGSDEGSLTDVAELSEQGPAADVPASVAPVDEEGAGAPDEEDDWLDPLNP